MIHLRIYKRDYAGNLRIWYAEVSECGTQYRTVSGIDGGSMVTSEWTTCKGNAQRPSAVDQCAFEVDALYRHRLARTYHQTIEATAGGAHYFEPMLAHPLDRKRLWFLFDKRADLEEHIGIKAPCVYIQPKLDGARCIATPDGLFSRQGKQYISCPHIEEALKPFFDTNPGAILDGELYGDKLADDFQQIMSLVRKTKNVTDVVLRQTKQFIQLHLYDAPHLGNEHYDVRRAEYNKAAATATFARAQWDPECIRVVETLKIHAWDQWDVAHAKWCEDGYEGSMGRLPDEPYENRRTHSLVKRKDFDDAEFDCAMMLEGNGNWSGACKKIMCWLPSVPAGQRTLENMDEDHTFLAVPRGSKAMLTKMLSDGVVPKQITGRFLGWTTSEIPKPRHCIAVMIWPEGRDV